jgi:hypothetical protein
MREKGGSVGLSVDVMDCVKHKLEINRLRGARKKEEGSRREVEKFL